MQVAFFSDVHGNAVGLEAVLREIERESPDEIVCLGDVPLFGPQPVAVVERIRQLDCPVIIGNTDEFALTREDEADKPQAVIDICEWGADQLSPEQLEFVESFEQSVRIQLDDDIALLAYHGSPRSPWEHIRVDASEAFLDEIVELTDATVLVGGHTHDQMHRTYRDVTFLNAGSVGYPTRTAQDGEEYCIPRAEWVLVEAENGSVTIEFRQTPFDLNTFREVTLQSDMPHRKDWLEAWQ